MDNISNICHFGGCGKVGKNRVVSVINGLVLGIFCNNHLSEYKSRLKNFNKPTKIVYKVENACKDR